MNCPSCGNSRSRTARSSGVKGLFPNSNANERQCTKCGRKWKEYEKNPRLLYFDIETAPVRIEADVWDIWDVHIRPENVKEDWFVLGWAAKWVCHSYIYSYVLRPSEAKKGNDKRILKPLWDLFNQADIIIGHNVDRFDVKKMNWRWIVNDFEPPMPYKTVDTLKELAKVAAPTSKSLDFVTKALNLNGKMKHRSGLFKECKAGDGNALRELRQYNEVDVTEGESLYLKLRPWMKSHPNMGLYYEDTEERCRNCGSTDLDYDREHPVRTSVNSFVCWTCKVCGAHGRTPESTRYETGEPGEDKADRAERLLNNRIKRETLMR